MLESGYLIDNFAWLTTDVSQGYFFAVKAETSHIIELFATYLIVALSS